MSERCRVMRTSSLVFDRYVLSHEVREGDGVRTWIGTDPTDGYVVLKCVDASTLSRAVRRRLDHEASVLSRLEHPNVPRVLDCGEWEGRLWLVAQFTRGIPLTTWRQYYTVTPQRIVSLGLAVCSALQAVHAHDVVHGDVKPLNIHVDGDDPAAAVLVDFGLSRVGRLPTLAAMCAENAVYVSPEAAGLVNRDIGPASDLYSLGAVLFEMASGRPPFAHEELGAVLRAHLLEPVPSPDGAPRSLGALIERLLQKDPRDRYPSAQAVIDDLRAIERALPTDQPPELAASTRVASDVAGIPRAPSLTLSLADRFEQILAVGRSVASALDPARVNGAVMDGAFILLRAKEVFVVPRGPEGNWQIEDALAARLCEAARESGDALVFDEMEDPRHRSTLLCPIRMREDVVACLYARHATVGCLFGEDERRIARYLTTLAGVALENSQSFAERNEAMRTLTFLSLDLHDVVAQPLVYMSYALHALSENSEVGEAVLQMSQTCQDLLARLRVLAGGLRQPVSANLEQLLHEIVERFRRESGVQADLVLKGPVSGVRGVTAIFVQRIIGEALSNVRRHARASRADVVVEVAEGRVRGRVVDDGRGFDLRGANVGGLHLGVVGMQQRARMLGGEVRLSSVPGEGTIVECELPID